MSSFLKSVRRLPSARVKENNEHSASPVVLPLRRQAGREITEVQQNNRAGVSNILSLPVYKGEYPEEVNALVGLLLADLLDISEENTINDQRIIESLANRSSELDTSDVVRTKLMFLTLGHLSRHALMIERRIGIPRTAMREALSELL